MAQLNFDATQVEPDAGFDTIPAGWYNAKIDESDLKPTKDGGGTYLQVRFAVIDGQYANRKLFARLNIKNANATTQEIALKQLSAIGHAVGVLHIANSEQLHGIPLKVKVKVRKGDDNYEDQNEIISYKNIDEAVQTVGGAAAAAAAGAPAASGVPAGFGAAPGFAAPTPPAAPIAAPVAPVAHNPVAAAEADGWAVHPTNPAYHWKGADVHETAKLIERYPAPAPLVPTAPAAPVAPVAPAVPTAPAAASTDSPWAGAPAAALAAESPFAGGAPAQPWAGGEAPAATAPAAPVADPAAGAAAAAQTAAPPWATQQ